MGVNLYAEAEERKTSRWLVVGPPECECVGFLSLLRIFFISNG